MTYLISVLGAIVVFMVIFGGVCQKNCHSTDEKERSVCRQVGGCTLLVIIMLMITAVVLSCGVPSVDTSPDNQEYYASLAPYVLDDVTHASSGHAPSTLSTSTQVQVTDFMNRTL
jgi:hypothetical protein